MSAPVQGSYIIPAVGTATYTIAATYTPAFIEFEVGAKGGSSENLVRRSSGWQDIANNRRAAISLYDDGTVRATKETTTASITHYDNVGGTLTQILSGYVASVGGGTITITMTIASPNYTIRYKAYPTTA